VRKSYNFDMPDKAYMLLNLFCNVCQFLHGSLAQSNDCGAVVKFRWNYIRVAAE